MTTIAKAYRYSARCSGCGWHMLLDERNRYTCCNTQCFQLGRPQSKSATPPRS